MKITALFVVTAAATMSALTAHADTVDPAQAIAQKFSDASVEVPARSQRSFTRPDAAYEADMLARARAEDQERRQQEAPLRAEQPAASAPAAKIAPPPQLAAPIEKLAALPPKPAAEPTRPRSEPSPLAKPTTAAATVLLVVDPDGTGLGFKPDPIICIDNTCWLSNGFRAPARSLPRNQAVALAGTDDMTSESCSGKSGCIYRNVIVDPTHRIDVIEVGAGRGASAGAYTIVADKSCRADGETLACDNGLATQNFRVWIVPETTAEAVGASRLENALAEGLPEMDVTSANDK